MVDLLSESSVEQRAGHVCEALWGHASRIDVLPWKYDLHLRSRLLVGRQFIKNGSVFSSLIRRHSIRHGFFSGCVAFSSVPFFSASSTPRGGRTGYWRILPATGLWEDGLLPERRRRSATEFA